MDESFEAKLIAASSKEVFKKAKQIIHNKSLVCCHEYSPGVLHAICRDNDGFVFHAELRGFPDGPFSGTCTCKNEFPGFCPHALAAALYHAKYTIKQKPEQVQSDIPAQYAGLKLSGLSELLGGLPQEFDAIIKLNCEDGYPHAPSQWEKMRFKVALSSGKRSYIGTVTNLRSLHFEKHGASFNLKQFSPQDRQIIRYLANYAQQEGSFLTLSAEHCSNFFHCLQGFQNFKWHDSNIVIHETYAQPVLLMEKYRGTCLLRPAILVDGSPLPLNEIKLISGQNGCWVGLLGEYWWIPAKAEVSWLRSFLRAPTQSCDVETAKTLLKSHNLPLKVIPTSGINLQEHNLRAFYDGKYTERGLEVELFFNYGNTLCTMNHARFASKSQSFFWIRDTETEKRYVDELLHFGFEGHLKKNGDSQSMVFILNDKESVGMFIDELIPRWEQEKREFVLSSQMIHLCSDSMKLRLKAKQIEVHGDLVDLAVELRCNGTMVRWSDLEVAAEKNESFIEQGKNTNLIRIPAALRQLASSLSGLITTLPANKQYPDAEIIRMPRQAAYYWAEAASELPGAVPIEFLQMKIDYDAVKELKKAPQIDPQLFTGELRPYQMTGVAWLTAMTERNCNLILADEMGLGKTVQILAYFAAAPKSHLPTLILCPTTLLHNWNNEIKRFLPQFRRMIVTGSKRNALWKKVPLNDIVITSYTIAKRDLEQIQTIPWQTLILDEAQHIKNPRSQNAQMCKQISSAHRIVLTGTPLENSITDIWSLFDFLHPGLLGTLPAFQRKYGDLERNASLKVELGRRIAPFMLRRRKKDVCQELPPKCEQVVFCEMTEHQETIYQNMEKQTQRICEDFKNGKSGVTKIHILSAILRLRQICCAPTLLPEFKDANVSSAKLELLNELLLQTIDSGHKVLLFSQFTTMLGMIAEMLDKMNISYEYLDGSVRNREERIDNFNQNENIRVFLLSLKVGGVGLNLTSADTVFLYDPWWNPAVEEQATDRSHRIGQTKSVNCVRLAVRNSIEERIFELHERKRKLFTDLVEDPADTLSSLELDDIEFLLGKKEE